MAGEVQRKQKKTKTIGDMMRDRCLAKTFFLIARFFKEGDFLKEGFPTLMTGLQLPELLSISQELKSKHLKVAKFEKARKECCQNYEPIMDNKCECMNSQERLRFSACCFFKKQTLNRNAAQELSMLWPVYFSGNQYA